MNIKIEQTKKETKEEKKDIKEQILSTRQNIKNRIKEATISENKYLCELEESKKKYENQIEEMINYLKDQRFDRDNLLLENYLKNNDKLNIEQNKDMRFLFEENETIECKLCGSTFQPSANLKKCSTIYPSGIECSSLNETCGCNITTCIVCQEQVCDGCLFIHSSICNTRCGYAGESSEIHSKSWKPSCHRLPMFCYLPLESEEELPTEKNFRCDPNWECCNLCSTYFCPDCYIIHRKEIESQCNCDLLYCLCDIDCSRQSKKTEKDFNKIKESLPNFKMQQRMYYKQPKYWVVSSKKKIERIPSIETKLALLCSDN